ncbi:MarR family winged helix-turn-helix transcriptional regulator [Streptomyces sp. NBC_01497]|uniref:MarR family winged helix-turn-helix transcriptional regulator n=1 Tax=Streptomyces sp. NBC_01497 TaxID=2903885 RepID=UPI002E2FCCDA|nr:MarR family winged helix-turn-helix transcriptional regulator [Streptomyces sp. NBC_01497]
MRTYGDHAAFGRPGATASTTVPFERSTISRNLDVLTQRGYVRVAATSSTGRTTRVAVTDAGYQALADAEPAWQRAQAWISEAVDPDAVDTLDRWLAALDLDQRAR